MIRVEENQNINAELRALYKQHTEGLLEKWEQAFHKDIESQKMEKPPCRINEFGIIDVHKYDSDNGILFIARETNGWKNEDYKKGDIFRDWMQSITKEGLAGKGHAAKHPNMWYNIGRWAVLLNDPERSITDIADAKGIAIKAIGYIAFTNINKVRGKNSSKKEYYQLANDVLVQDILKREIEIIKPKMIVCCGTADIVRSIVGDFACLLFEMPHPGARKSKTEMLKQLSEQIHSQKQENK